MIAFGLIAALLLVPAIPIAFAWRRLRILKSTSRISYVLALQTLSLVLIFAGIVHSHALGPDYSRVRFAVIWTWLAISTLTAVLGLKKTPVRLLIVIAGTYLALDWFYILAISSVV
jgi:hypothetical protein